MCAGYVQSLESLSNALNLKLEIGGLESRGKVARAHMVVNRFRRL